MGDSRCCNSEGDQTITCRGYRYKASLGKYQPTVAKEIGRLSQENIVARIWKKDYTVWKPTPDEISNRMGWLDSPAVMSTKTAEINDFREEVYADGFRQALLLGMGGSSLAPEVFANIFGRGGNSLKLSVLSSTDPMEVLKQEEWSKKEKTLFIVSTKSGGTIETISFMKYFYNSASKQVGADKAGDYFIAITDPGSGLEEIAKKLKFRRIFLNNPCIGGRYSALSYFGLLPAALIGVDTETILNKGKYTATDTSKRENNLAALLGCSMGALSKEGRDKTTFILSPKIAHFGRWLEQLIAESTGKEGKGVLPVIEETFDSPERYSRDRLFTYIKVDGDNSQDTIVNGLINSGEPVVEIVLDSIYDLGGQFILWEVATVIAGWSLGINPYDQPNVESSKVLSNEIITKYREEGRLPEIGAAIEDNGLAVYTDVAATNIDNVLSKFISQGIKEGKSYASIQAFIEPTEENETLLKELRKKIGGESGIATTLGFGPQFLHSTGQLYKGDGGGGIFIQFVSATQKDAVIPDEGKKIPLSFGILKRAQMLGDRESMLRAGRKVISFDLGNNIKGNLKRLTEGYK
ncbi:MAG: hypothetical protein KKC21_04415 [Nitrospinae bacterium]|nr:hypothetical protein [Nitrospinota bacterium]